MYPPRPLQKAIRPKILGLRATPFHQWLLSSVPIAHVRHESYSLSLPCSAPRLDSPRRLSGVPASGYSAFLQGRPTMQVRATALPSLL
jgi:hypothetical protein